MAGSSLFGSMPLMSRIATAASCHSRVHASATRSLNASSPMAAMPVASCTGLPARHTSRSRSFAAGLIPKASRCCRAVGWSSGPSPGSSRTDASSVTTSNSPRLPRPSSPSPPPPPCCAVGREQAPFSNALLGMRDFPLLGTSALQQGSFDRCSNDVSRKTVRRLIAAWVVSELFLRQQPRHVPSVSPDMV